MTKFTVTDSEVIFDYAAIDRDNGWAWRELCKRGAVTFNRTFTFRRDDLVSEPTNQDAEGEYEEFEYRFRFATRSDSYFHIDGRIFNIPNKVLLADTGLTLRRTLFVAERNISIFARISELLPQDQEIVIGGERAEAVPIPAFEELLRKFPNTTEVNRYAAARVASVLGDYFERMDDAQGRYETYLTRTRSMLKGAQVSHPELLQTELEKYILIRDTIADWLLTGASRTEADWQKMIASFLLLIFPKYVKVLEKVHVKDFHSKAGVTSARYIDLALVDASGNIDVIEIKKPVEDALLSRGKYRDNYVPSKELAGSIMQAEKYLFYLAKWGVKGEQKLTDRYKKELPPNLAIRITNPKAMIILGRDRRMDGTSALSPNQLLDLEVIKRKYANMMDIMTYDDLLSRLGNIIASLRGRLEE